MTNSSNKRLQQIHVAALPIEPMHALLDREEARQLDEVVKILQTENLDVKTQNLTS